MVWIQDGAESGHLDSCDFSFFGLDVLICIRQPAGCQLLHVLIQYSIRCFIVNTNEFSEKLGKEAMSVSIESVIGSKEHWNCVPSAKPFPAPGQEYASIARY